MTFTSRLRRQVGDREQGVRVGRKVDPDDLRLLVDDVVDETRVLVREAVVERRQTWDVSR